MKMKRIFAMLLAMVMVFAMVTGCSKKANKANEGGSSDPSTSIVQTITFKMTGFEDASADLTLTLKGFDGASSISVNGSFNAEGETVDLNFNEVLTIAKDKVYVNVKEIMTVLESVSSMDFDMPSSEELEGITSSLEGFDIESIKDLFEADWIYMEMEGMSDAVKIDTTFQDGLIASIEKEMQAFAKTEGDTTTYKLETAEDYKNAMNALVKAVKDNRDAWVDYSYTSAKSIDTEKMMDGIMDAYAEMLAEMYGGLVSADQIKDQLAGSMDTSSVEIKKEDIETSVDEMIKSLEESVEKADFDLLKAVTEIKTTEKANGYTISFKVQDTESEGCMEMSVDVTTGTPVTITEPSGAKNVMDMLSSILTSMGGMMGGLQ
jgi:hypothetical protein